MDADADLDLVLAELERRLAHGRDCAGGQCHAHAAPVRVDELGDIGHFRERAALLSGGTGDLLQEHGDPHAAPAGRIEAVLDRDIVIRNDGRDLDTGLCSSELGGHLEVHDVAGVVLHDVQDAGAAVDALGRLEHLVGYRRGEDFTGAGSVQHSVADEPAVQWLVARPAARDQSDLSRHRSVGAVDDLVGVIDAEVWVCCLDPEQCFGHHVGRVVDELLHGDASVWCRR